MATYDNSDITNILDRLSTLETSVANLNATVNKLVSLNMMSSIANKLNASIEDTNKQLSDLKSQVAFLNNIVNN